MNNWDEVARFVGARIAALDDNELNRFEQGIKEAMDLCDDISRDIQQTLNDAVAVQKKEAAIKRRNAIESVKIRKGGKRTSWRGRRYHDNRG